VSTIAEIQAKYRRELVELWEVKPGWRILEIGCGQGETTEALLRAVGTEGFVTALDIASPDYGAPETIGQATSKIKDGELGSRVSFRFMCNVLDPGIEFSKEQFDAVVLAHSSWYFADVAQFSHVFDRVREWSDTLLFAEWNLRPASNQQIAHYLAIRIQAQLECFKPESQSNVRLPMSEEWANELIQASGWQLDRQALPDTRDLQDADWEIRHCLDRIPRELEELDLSHSVREHLRDEIRVLRQAALPQKNIPLGARAQVWRGSRKLRRKTQ
jgi:ubiquinone/menaquinone biosynthesis C-methylase UbiE